MSSPENVRFFHALRSVRIASHREPAPPRADLEQQLRESYRNGYAEASGHATQQIVEQRDEVNHLREKLFRSLEKSVTSAVAEVRQALPILTMQAVRRVLARAEVDRPLVEGIVNELLAEIGPDIGPIELRLHPADLALVQDLEPQLAAIHPGLRFVGDEALSRGDCQAVTRFGKIDARIQNKVEKLEATLFASL